MADVRLTIAGRPDDVHCADGQEEQLVQLATLVDEKARGIQGGTEVRQLLFAALMLADEANEARGKAEKAEPQSDSLRAAVALAESREAAARDELRAAQIGRAHVCTPVTNAHLVCRLLLEKKNKHNNITHCYIHSTHN